MRKKLFKKLLITSLISLGAILAVISVICYVVTSASDGKILSVEELVEAEYSADCIMVLGAKVNGNEPSLMLRDRLDKGIELHSQIYTPLLMSGDCSSEEYNEVGVMKNYALEQGVDESAVLTDPEGYSTFESVTRLSQQFNSDKVIIVSQRYHLPRALYIAKEAGIEAVGVPAEEIFYYGHTKRLLREAVAQVKDFFLCLFI